MTQERIRQRLREDREAERLLNIEMGQVDKQIRVLNRKKAKLARNVSKLMKNSNELIAMLAE